MLTDSFFQQLLEFLLLESFELASKVLEVHQEDGGPESPIISSAGDGSENEGGETDEDAARDAGNEGVADARRARDARLNARDDRV